MFELYLYFKTFPNLKDKYIFIERHSYILPMEIILTSIVIFFFPLLLFNLVPIPKIPYFVVLLLLGMSLPFDSSIWVNNSLNQVSLDLQEIQHEFKNIKKGLSDFQVDFTKEMNHLKDEVHAAFEDLDKIFLRSDENMGRYLRALDLPKETRDFKVIKAQYRKLIKEFCPDIHPEYLERAQEINNAYDELEKMFH